MFGQVVLLFKLANPAAEPMAIIAKWEARGDGPPHTLRMETEDRGLALHATSAIQAAMVYSRTPGRDAALVKLPPQFRC